MTDKELLKEARDLIVMCSLLDKSGQCKAMADKIDNQLNVLDINNCAFQYWNGRKLVEDKSEITLDEAKKIWNEHYDDMVQQVTDGEDIEVAIWINMKEKCDYNETLVHLYSPDVKNGRLYEPKYYDVY